MTPPTITAYSVSDEAVEVRPLPGQRAWMNATRAGHAYHCHPMVMANQWGWALHTPASIIVCWSGGDKPGMLHLYDLAALLKPRSRSLLGRLAAKLLESLLADSERNAPYRPLLRWMLGGVLSLKSLRRRDAIARCVFRGSFAESIFGYGILSFRPGRLFRTSQGHNLWVKGPPNVIQEGAAPLEGMVEADWLPFTFTMNWKLLAPRRPVIFEAGAAFASIVPYPRDYIESFSARIEALESEPELKARYQSWHDRREAGKARRRTGESSGRFKSRQHYRKGIDTQGNEYSEHQRSIALAKFEQSEPVNPRESDR